MYGQMPHLPHELTMARLESLGGDMTPDNYHCYAGYLKEVLERYSAAFREAKMAVSIKRNIEANRKLKDISHLEWLAPGKLVIAFRPTSYDNDGQKWSSKLIYQYSGPYRIVSIHKSAVHLENLDGTPARTQNIRSVYRYNRECDPLLIDVDNSLMSDQ